MSRRETREWFSDDVRSWRSERAVVTETVRLYRRRGLSEKNAEICRNQKSTRKCAGEPKGVREASLTD